MSSIKHMIATELMTILQEECINKIPEDSKSRVTIIGIRKTIGEYKLALTVQHFHPMEMEAWSDAIVGAWVASTSDGSKWPTQDSTGATFEKIRGSVQLDANLTRTKELPVAADEIIQEVIARAKWAMRTRAQEIRGLKDSYGETVQDFRIVGTVEYDSGAENANTSRAFIKWVAITYASRGG